MSEYNGGLDFFSYLQMVSQIPNNKFRILNLEFRILNSDFWIFDSDFRILHSECQIHIESRYITYLHNCLQKVKNSEFSFSEDFFLDLPGIRGW